MDKKTNKPKPRKLSARLKAFYLRNWQWLWTTLISFASLWLRAFSALTK